MNKLSLNPSSELYDLTDRMAAGVINPEGRDRLEYLLRTDAGARLFYVAYLDQHAELHWRNYTVASPLSQKKGVSPSATRDEPVENIRRDRKGGEPHPSRIRPHHIGYALAAILLVAAYSAVVYLYNADPNPESVDPQPQTPVATLIQSTPGSNLTTPGGFIAEGRDYGRGEYTLDTGTAEFMLTNSVNVKMRGGTRMHVRNNMDVSLTHGSAEFACPTDAKGFTVRLPGDTRIVDLGTRFDVKIVEDGYSEIRVLEGSVRVERANVEPVVLSVGQSIRAPHDTAAPTVMGRSPADTHAVVITSEPGLSKTYDLTRDYGSLDWACWASTGAAPDQPGSPTYRKARGSMIDPMTAIGGGSLRGSVNEHSLPSFALTDGEPSGEQVARNTIGPFNSQIGKRGAGVEVLVTFDDARPYTVYVWAVALQGRAQLSATLGAHTATDQTLVAGNPDRVARLYTITVHPDFPGETLSLQLTIAKRGGSHANASIAAVAVAPDDSVRSLPDTTTEDPPLLETQK